MTSRDQFIRGVTAGLVHYGFDPEDVRVVNDAEHDAVTIACGGAEIKVSGRELRLNARTDELRDVLLVELIKHKVREAVFASLQDADIRAIIRARKAAATNE